MVHDGRTVCWLHFSHRSFFEILSCDLHLGDGDGGKGAGEKTVKRSGELKIGYSYSSMNELIAGLRYE